MASADFDFDFDRSVEQAWRRFAWRLTDVLSMMDETEPLTLQPSQADPDQWYVRFTQEYRGRLTARVPKQIGADPLTEQQAATLVKLGWEQAASSFQLTGNQDHCDQLASAAVAVLREVFAVEHPVFLDSNVLAEILQEPSAEEAAEPADNIADTLVYPNLDEVQLAAVVSDELSQVFGAVPMRDQDGDFAVRVGSTMIFVRISADQKEIRLFSVLVHDVSGRSRAMEVLNDINAHARWVRFSLVRDKIIATMSVLASPFVPVHVRQAITEMTHVADGVDDLLAASLEGKTTFQDDE
jgi:hypothetical protein